MLTTPPPSTTTYLMQTQRASSMIGPLRCAHHPLLVIKFCARAAHDSSYSCARIVAPFRTQYKYKISNDFFEPSDRQLHGAIETACFLERQLQYYLWNIMVRSENAVSTVSRKIYGRVGADYRLLHHKYDGHDLVCTAVRPGVAATAGFCGISRWPGF